MSAEAGPSGTVDAVTGRRLQRPRDGRPVRPVRLVHLGLGNFFRAHQAWFTEHADDAADWGYLAFTGRRPVDDLRAQDDLYTLIERGPVGDRPEVVSALSGTGVSTDLEAWRRAFLLPELAVVTLTVTEAGYRRGPDGGLDVTDPAVTGDVAALRSDGAHAAVTTVPGRLVAGILGRRAAGLGPLTVVPCDNVPANGEMAARVVGGLADLVDPSTAAWASEHVGFVSTLVDRITPRTVPSDRVDLASATGVDDPACVVTEPYREWVLSGTFLGPRPAWESSGAVVVDDVEPWERRKLWLLNGSHSLMAYAGSILGAETVAEAIADPRVRGWVEEWWGDCGPLLPLPADDVADYRTALLGRYSNPRIRHRLAQIAEDGSQKVPIRTLPTLRHAVGSGTPVAGATRIVAAWTLHLRGLGAPVVDAGASGLQATIASLDLPAAVGAVLGWLGVDDDRIRRRTTDQAVEIAGLARA